MMYFAQQLIQAKANRQAEGETSMGAINAVTDLSREGDIAVVTINSPPVNALSANVPRIPPSKPSF
jgi:ABC-type sugar transport system substrate-binding protein